MVRGLDLYSEGFGFIPAQKTGLMTWSHLCFKVISLVLSREGEQQ